MDKAAGEESVIKEGSPEPSASEVKARELGWRPKDEYEGDKRWVDAEEFVERQELYDGIHKANRKTKKMEKVVETLMIHNKKIEEAAFQKALDALKQEKLEAAKDNDISKVVVIDEEITKLKEQAKPNTPPSTTSAQEEVFEEWKVENTWFDEASPDFDEDMQAYANGLGSKLETQNPGTPPEKLLAEVAKRTKVAFEWKFKNRNREAPNKVGSSSNKGKGTSPRDKQVTYDDLSPEAKDMYRTLVKSDKNPYGVMSAEAYLADYTLAADRKKGAK